MQEEHSEIENPHIDFLFHSSEGQNRFPMALFDLQGKKEIYSCLNFLNMTAYLKTVNAFLQHI